MFPGSRQRVTPAFFGISEIWYAKELAVCLTYHQPALRTRVSCLQQTEQLDDAGIVA
jgi:hypothetical protein